MPRVLARRRPWVPLEDAEEAALRESVRMLVEVAQEMPFKRTRNEALKVALFQITEQGGGPRKTAPRYRSKAAFDDLNAKCQHEHVVGRKWLQAALAARPDLMDEILGMAVGCLVTKTEHRQLEQVDPALFGWQRYRAAEIEVRDAGDGFAPLDLDPLIERQLSQLARVHAVGEASARRPS